MLSQSCAKYIINTLHILWQAKSQLELNSLYQNINCTQATALPSPQQQRMVLSAAAWRKMQRARYNALLLGRKFVPGDLDLWPSSERGTKHVFHVNLAQIRSVVPKIFDSQTKKNKKVTDSAKNRTLCSLLHVAIICALLSNYRAKTSTLAPQ